MRPFSLTNLTMTPNRRTGENRPFLRHCERSEAIQRTGAGVLHRSANDNRPTRGLWIASSLARLAMTVLANDVRSSSPDMDCRVAFGSSQ
jgi:hypothetical protein